MNVFFAAKGMLLDEGGAFRLTSGKTSNLEYTLGRVIPLPVVPGVEKYLQYRTLSEKFARSRDRVASSWHLR